MAGTRTQIFIGADRDGFRLKEHIEHYLKSLGYKVKDVSGNKFNSQDEFSVHAAVVAGSVLANEGSRGVLLCGSSQGICMTANRFKGIRASLVWSEKEAELSRRFDDANVLCLPVWSIKDLDDARRLVDVWLASPFDEEAQAIRRLKQMDEVS